MNSRRIHKPNLKHYFPYAKAGGPPDNWTWLIVYDADTMKEINHVYEVNAVEGWARIYDYPVRIDNYKGEDLPKTPGNYVILLNPFAHGYNG
jgi:hypothetical protein